MFIESFFTTLKWIDYGYIASTPWRLFAKYGMLICKRYTFRKKNNVYIYFDNEAGPYP